MGWKKTPLDYDPAEGRRETFWFNDDDGKFLVETEWDYTDIVETNKALYAQTDERAGWKGDVHRIGSVPLSIYYDLMQRSGWGRDQQVLRRFFNDPDNRHFLTRPVKL